ncbi:hypothetical protein Vadar_007802 [Vaccinium darrowii]|uniref:Uncharacterized protein n=1 Tax=Vaccinium darrowii TaxID=229202 RepID=A0ACB7YTW2_9ERIC|nr:hypothetical protein Vadar_007802 [Vaccinium darrowii]
MGTKIPPYSTQQLPNKDKGNQLSKIKDSNGNWLDEDKVINEHLQTYFSSLFKSNGPRDFEPVLQKVERCITDEMNAKLTRMVSDVEIKEAVFQLGALKAPRPGGFNRPFYQQFWDVVGPDEFSQSLEIPNVLMDNQESQEEQSSWRAPDMGKIKVICDVALPKLGNNSKILVVLRDWKGRVMDGLAKTVHAESSLDGELQAIRMACVMVNSLDLKEAVIESK